MSGTKAMIATDFAIMRGSLASTAGLSLVVAIALAIGMQNLVPAVAAVSAMVPLLLLTTLGAYDDYNNWGSFRLALPLSRRQVVLGRYATLLIAMAATAAVTLAFGCLVLNVSSLIPGELAAQLQEDATPIRIAAGIAGALSCTVIACAVTLPLAMRFGMTKAVRFVPVFAAVAFALALAIIGSSGSPLESNATFAHLLLWIDASDLHLLAISATILAEALMLYLVSALLAVRLYKTREL